VSVSGRRSFPTWALGLLVLTLFVILWGAFVRVTGSGAGCADHWPLCNGELVPRSPRVETLIELTHRITSGLSGLLAVAVYLLARRSFPRGSAVRGAALTALILMLIEGAIGAMLVKLGLVAKDSSPLRALVVAGHLGNTFLLVAAQLATWWLGRGLPPPRWRDRRGMGALLGLSLAALLALGASGAVTALGDTLFPATSLAQGLRQDLAPGTHFLLRLRALHPLLAVLIGGAIVYLSQHLRALLQTPQTSRWAAGVSVLYVLQLIAGALNLLLLAPTGLQIVHLFLADLVWLALVGLSLSALSSPLPQASLASAAS
jgi:heme A synthase